MVTTERNLAWFELVAGTVMLVFGFIVWVSTQDGSESWHEGSAALAIAGGFWLLAGGLAFLNPYAGLAGFWLLLTGGFDLPDPPMADFLPLLSSDLDLFDDLIASRVMLLTGLLGVVMTLWYSDWGNKVFTSSLSTSTALPFSQVAPVPGQAISAIVRAVPLTRGPMRTVWSFVVVDQGGREYGRSAQFRSANKAPSYMPDEYRALTMLLDEARRNGWEVTRFPSHGAQEWWAYFLDR